MHREDGGRKPAGDGAHRSACRSSRPASQSSGRTDQDRHQQPACAASSAPPLARFALANPDPSVRLAAVTEMRALARRGDRGAAAAARGRGDRRRRQIRDRDRAGARGARRHAIATPRLAAIETLGEPARRRGAQSAGGARRARLPTAPSSSRRGGAARRGRRAVRRIDSSRSFYAAVETLFFGLSLGSVLVLVAIGLAITFGVMGVINMAHGELMMLGAYTTYVVQSADARRHLGWSIAVAIPAAFLVAGLAGIAARADRHPLSLRPAARDAARDVRREPGAAAARPLGLLGQQPRGVDAAPG